MSSNDQRDSTVSQARRHFIGLAAIAGTKLATIGVAAATLLPGSRVFADDPGKPKGESKPMCLLRGTSIDTPVGEVAIEDLKIGDLVMTASGKFMPVRWIGSHAYTRGSAAWNPVVLPVRISANAIADGVPRRDLYLSRRHSLFIDGMLIRAMDLVNGKTITLSDRADQGRLDYFHILLDSHEAILAEGAPVESFLLEGNTYEGFSNFAEFARLQPAGENKFMIPLAQYVKFGGKEHMKSLLYLSLGPMMRPRSPIQTLYRRISTRADH